MDKNIEGVSTIYLGTERLGGAVKLKRDNKIRDIVYLSRISKL